LMKSPDDNQCQKETFFVESQALTANPEEEKGTSGERNESAKVPTDDRGSTTRERCSNKLSNKPDPDLTFIVDAWPDLPEAVRSSIMMLVRASVSKDGG